MEQRVKKARLFRTLKVVYYCLGLPVFLFAVLALVSQNYGHVPFVGPGEGHFAAIKALFSSPAMYAVWIALGIWLVIGLVQLICKFAIKNRRTRAMVVVAIMLVVLLVPMFAIDALYTTKIAELQESAPAGTVVKDYKYQLSYYRTQTSGSQISGKTTKNSLTDNLKANVLKFCQAYNVSMYGSFFGGNAQNFTNEALYYDVFNFDYNEDGVVDSYDHILIRTEPETDVVGDYNKIWADSLTLVSMSGANEEVVYGNFYSVHYTQAVSPDADENVECYLWYDGDKASFAKTDGVYGEAYYKSNGMLADGYVYSVPVALEILEDYYEAQAEMKEVFKATGKSSEADFRKEIEDAAFARQEEYYTGADATEEQALLWEREKAYAAGYSLTVPELNRVLNELGGALGGASLLKDVTPLLGMLLPSLLGGPLNIETILGLVLGGMPETMAFLTAQMSPELLNIELQLKWNTADGHDNLMINVVKPGADTVSINLDDNFSVATVKDLLDSLGISNNMLAEVITMIGLEVSGTSDNSVAGLEEMLAGLLESLYWYRSAVLLPEYDFYVDETLDPEDETDAAIMAYQAAYAKYKRAEYEGGLHGSMAGSRLIGSSIGNGTYGANFALKSLKEVQQLKLDLSYQPTMYSILIVRDMLMTFAAFILFFTMMSYIAADREILWATGQIDLKKGKKKTKKVAENNEEVA